MRRLMFVLGFSMAACAAEAKDLYVSPTGDDAVTYAANSATRPWRTIGRAAWGSSNRSSPNEAEAARAGDVVHIAAGTYTTVGNLSGGGGGRWDVAYNPANHGTATAPIRFQCEDGPCVLTYSSGAGPMIGANIRNHIQWSGFTISEATAPSRSDTGPVIFMMADGGLIENSILVGNPNWPARGGDNYTGIRLEDTANIRIAHNTIRDFGGQLGDRNHAGIETYRSYPVIIEHNLIEHCSTGIYMKAVHTSTLAVDRVDIRLNRFVNNRWGVNAHRMPMTETKPMLIYQNVFERNREAGVWLTAFDNGATDPKWIRVFNNTFVDNVAALFNYNDHIWQPNSGHLYVNNIIVGGEASIRMDTTDVRSNATRDRQTYDRNLYFGAAAFGNMGESAQSFRSWQRLGQDANSLTADPRFVGRGDYRLAADSPARTMGRAVYGIGGADDAVIPAGAYITGDEQIGPGKP
jgi:hypothetical protein